MTDAGTGAATSNAQPQLDENVFKQFHAKILRRAGLPGPEGHYPQGLLSRRATSIPSRTAANA